MPIPRNLLDGYGQTGTSDFEMKSYAAFGEVNYDITEKLTATLGPRYTYEDKDGTYSTPVFGGTDLSALPAANPFVSRKCPPKCASRVSKETSSRCWSGV